MSKEQKTMFLVAQQKQQTTEREKTTAGLSNPQCGTQYQSWVIRD